MRRGEIWLVSLNPTSGHEQKRRCPVLPIASGGNFARTAGFALPLTGPGAKTTGVIRCDQPRALDIAARGGKKLESSPEALMDEVLAKISPILE